MLMKYRITRLRVQLVDCIARIVLSLCILAAACAVFIGAMLLLVRGASAAPAQAVSASPIQPAPASPARTEQVEGALPSGAVPMKVRDAQSGTLLFKAGGKGGVGETFAVPQVATDAVIRVSGLVARTQVRQTFRNPYDDWYEGVYVFPLPDNAAVDHLRMKIGARSVDGEIRERAAAKAAYEQAKAGGQRAALLEQERANMFTSSVANVGPREEIVVEIEYQQTLTYDNGRLSLRFPTVVGPRFIPGGTAQRGDAEGSRSRRMPGDQSVSFQRNADAPFSDSALPAGRMVHTLLANAGGSGWGTATDAVPDAARITPPVLHPSLSTGPGKQPINPVSIRVELDAGAPIDKLDSAYHRVETKTLDAQRREITLAGGNFATRDFELAWSLARGAAPLPALFTERMNGKTYGLLMLVPPAASATAKPLPREVIYIIDTSGSMEGTSIAQARDGLALAIGRLGAGDRFNVIEFNSYAKALFDEARPATRDNLAIATDWVRRLKARGGTEMALALNLALNGGENAERVRQVVFLTDGQVGNEEQLFKLITERLGDSRLFTVGIGAAPNSHFMRRAAQAGRGTYTYIGKIDEVKDKMTQLFAKLESPVLKGVQVNWPGAAATEAWPKRIPDLYLGEPIVVSAALNKASGGISAGNVEISGLNGDAMWKASLPLDTAHPGQGMGVLWAREKIASLTDTLREGANEEAVRPAIVEVALAHHLLSKYTSLVAIDKTPVRPPESVLKAAAVPTNLPDGQSYEAIFGELPQGATDAQFNMLAGLMLLIAAWLVRRMRSSRDTGAIGATALAC